jgi:hypothetical protein
MIYSKKSEKSKREDYINGRKALADKGWHKWFAWKPVKIGKYLEDGREMWAFYLM